MKKMAMPIINEIIYDSELKPDKSFHAILLEYGMVGKN